MEIEITSSWPTQKVKRGQVSNEEDQVANETPITVVVNGKEFATVVCSPVQIQELMIGFLAAEGLIRSTADILSFSTNDSQGFVYIEVSHLKDLPASDVTKRFIGSCCGKSRQFYFKNDVKTAKTIMTTTHLTMAQCLELMKGLKNDSQAFSETGGVHNAALCLPNKIVKVTTDIGRHNTLDKLYGHLLLNKLVAKDHVIAFSGRISSEVVLKVSKMGIGILLSKSAPTDLALKLASDLNITTVGFIRDERMNIYTHPERINCHSVEQSLE